MSAQPAEPLSAAPGDARSVRAALSASDRVLFDQEYGRALSDAQAPVYDLGPVLDVVERWRRVVLLAPGAAAALEIAERELAGFDVPGLAPVALAALRSA